MTRSTGKRDRLFRATADVLDRVAGLARRGRRRVLCRAHPIVDRFRATLGIRLLFAQCTIAAFATVLALTLQDRSLSIDLGEAARARLERSSAAANQLIDDHLAALAERYLAIAGTPQFLANVEAGHGPTLQYFAAQLAERHGAHAIAFLDRTGRELAHQGDAESIAVIHRRAAEPGSRAAATAELVAYAAEPAALAIVPLRVEGERIGDLAVLELISEPRLAVWSKLCGARVTIGGQIGADDVALSVREVDGLNVRISESLAAERAALTNSRRTLLVAGLVSVLLAFLLSFYLTRSLLRPIRAIQAGAERIGDGDFEFRLGETRDDEVGDVARAFDHMLERLAKTQGRLANAQRLARLGHWGLDLGTGLIDASIEFRKIVGFRDAATPVTIESFLSRVDPEEREQVRQALEACIEDGRVVNLDHRTVAIEGTRSVVHLFATRTAGGALEGTVQDVTERRRTQEQIRHLAYHDSLTRLGNRRLFKERLRLALGQARRSNTDVAVLFLDLDRFKDVNDTLGHSVGDELLLEAADRIVKGTDAAYPDRGDEHSSLVTRLGGDEFTVLLTEVQTREEIEQVARKLQQVLAEPFRLRSREVTVSVSIGIAVAPQDGADVETLLRRADTAMYHAKNATASRFQFYEESMQQAARRRLALENKLRRAIENEEFELFYQPKEDLRSRSMTGVEALLRWRDPEDGIIGPSEFIPVAEETGLVVEIGEWVLRTAIRQAVAWQHAGLPPIRVAVNMSAHQLEDHARFVRTIAELLESTGLDPKWLDLEITESTLMKDEDTAIAVLEELRAMGIGLALDDFGTGFSSLSYVRRLPIDTLKIDRSFVRRVCSDPDDAALAAAIIHMAKALRLRVVVEGVETQAQREFLEDLGCDEIQGFLFYTPVTADEVAEILADQLPRKKKGRRKKAGRAR